MALSTLARIACLALIYTGVGKLGLMLAPVSGFATLVWAPTGISLAALLLLGYRLWPGVWLGAFVVNVWTGAPPLVAIGIATGNTLEALLGAYAMRRLAGFRGSFNGLRHVVGLLVPAAILSTLVAATLGVTSLVLGGIVASPRVLVTWRAWWVGDALGDLIVAPLLLAWATDRAVRRRPLRALEGLLLGATMTSASLAVFARPSLAPGNPFELRYVLFPLFVWAAVRFGIRGATMATALASALAIWGTVRGMGPFARGALSADLLALQSFMGAAAFTPLVVAGSIFDRARSEGRFRRLVDAGIIGIITADVAGNILEANDAFLKMFGYTSDEILLGKVRWADMTPGERGPLDEYTLEHLKTAGISDALEKEYVRKDGSRVPVLVGAAILDGTAGECVAYILDLTTRKQAEAAIERLRKEREASLEASVRERDDFLAIAGHELKTPMAALLLQLQSLQRGLQKDPGMRVRDRIDKAAASGWRLERLVNQLLDVSRIRAGRFHLEPESFDLREVVREVVARFADAGMLECPIVVRGENEAHGSWDRFRVEQVVTNLVGNAIKYGQGKPVEIDLHVLGGHAVLRVRDHGIGIDAEHQKKIFRRFERAVAARDFGGLGLGLWIARTIVEASGGEIDVESAPDQGATFTVRLPIDPGGDMEMCHANE